MKKTHRTLVLMLALLLVFTVLPIGAQAAAEPISVTAGFQNAGDFVIAPQTIEVEPGLAAQYGFENDSMLDATDVSVLDVLVALHELHYGENFTAETVANYLTVSGGSIGTLFGITTYSVGFSVNDAAPNDGVLSSYGYTGYMVTQAKVVEGDTVNFYIYSDTQAYGDIITWFEKNDRKVSKIVATTNDEINLTLQGYSYMWWGCYPEETIQSNTKAVADAQILTVNAETGDTTVIADTVTDENGAVSLSFDEPGTYYISALEDAEALSPIFKPWCEVQVCEPAVYPTTSPEVPDDFANDLWLQYDFKTLTVNETTTIYPRRVPQITSSDVSGEIFRPNFNFEIVEGNSIELSDMNSSDKVTVTADRPGITIVKVTYDAATYKEVEYGACSTVNTAYVIYDVQAEGEGADTIINTDLSDITSYDTIYFFSGEYTPYTFNASATNDAALTVTCNGEVLTAEDGAYTANLENRANIIGMTAELDGKTASYYQVVDARKVDVTVTNETNPDTMLVSGDTANVSFKGITMPVYKLVRIYNPTFVSEQWGNNGTYVQYDNASIGTVKGVCEQYDLDTNNDFSFTWGEEESYTFSNGLIFSEWWGQELGFDKALEGNNEPQMNVDALSGEFSILPDLTVTNTDTGSKNITVTVGIYDYTASDMKIAGASEDGVVLDTCEVTVKDGDMAIDAIEAALDAASITYEKNSYGYISSIGTLAEYAENYPQSGWMFCLNKNFGNLGTNDQPIADGDAVEMHYSLTGYGTDVGSYWGVVPTLTEFTLAGQTLKLSLETTYDEEYNATTTYYVGEGEQKTQLTGNGSEEEPFELDLVLPAGTDLKTLTATIKTDLHDHYYSLKPEGSQDYTNPVTLTLSTMGDVLTTYYRVTATVAEPVTYVNLPADELDKLAKAGKEYDLTVNGIDFVLSVEALQALADLKADVVIDAQLADNGDTVIKVTRNGQEQSGIGGITVKIPVDKAGISTVAYLVKADNKLELIRKAVLEDKATSSALSAVTGYMLVPINGSATIRIADNEKTFNDIKGYWAEDNIHFVAAHELVNGISANIFAPRTTMTRAIFVTMLWRLENEPEVSHGTNFSDVNKDTYYAEAVAWASANKIVEGIGNNRFDPKANIRRQDIAVMVSRYAAYCGLTPTADLKVISGYSDHNDISTYAKPAMAWACASNLITGRTATTLNPRGNATRAEGAAILDRFIHYLAQ